MAYARFRCGVAVGGVAGTGTFIDQTTYAAGPLRQEFVNIVAAHLVHDEEHDKFGARRRFPGNRRLRPGWRCRLAQESGGTNSYAADGERDRNQASFCRSGAVETCGARSAIS